MSVETLALIMPVYNESAIVGEVLSRWESMLGRLGVDYQIYAYNDGSKDNSLAILKNYAEAPGCRVTVIDQPNSGHGPTVLRGYRECCGQYDWIFQLDSDDEIAPEEFIKLWELRSDYDFVIGKRAGRVQNWSRLLISKISTYSAQMLYGCSFDDVNCPYRLMRASAFAPLFREVPENSFAPNVMLSGLAGYYNLRSAEIPVAQSSRRTGEVSIRRFKLAKSALLSFWQLFRMRRQLIRHLKLLQFAVLSFILALVCLLQPERHEQINLGESVASSGVTVFTFYTKKPMESIQQIDLELVWRLKKMPAANEALFFLPNAGVKVGQAQLSGLDQPLRPAQTYGCKWHLYDDYCILYSGVSPDFKELSRKIGRAQYIQTDASQLILINNNFVELKSGQGQITIDRLLPKIIGVLFAGLGTVLSIVFILKSGGVIPTRLERRKLFMVAATVASGMALALITCWIARLSGQAFPYDTFLFFPEDRFNDLFNTFTVVRFWDHPYLEPIPGAGYFPFSYLLFKLIPSGNQVYVIFFAFSLFISFYLVSAFVLCRYRGWLAVTGLLVILFLNYPLWFMLDRGNTDFCVYMFIFLFAWFYRKRQDWAAIFCLICVVNLKLYPAILAVLYLKDRAYRQFFAAALGSVALLLLSFGYYDWDFAGFLKIMKDYNGCYVSGMEGVFFGHSLYGLIKITAHRFWNVNNFVMYEQFYVYVAMLLAAVVSAYVIWIEKVFWRSFYLLLAMMLLLPHVSFDYRMIVLVIPALHFLADDSADKNYLVYSLFWGLLLIPIHWVFLFHGEPRPSSVFLRPLLLIGFVVFIMISGMCQWYRDHGRSCRTNVKCAKK